ncbi:MAG TPA: DsbA family protein [Propionicimonas sp.]|nr:DsbA family protein [Propionicimonas sp.]HRA05645.1 DsbA family protein [Propionicimonas sp.]
MAKNSQELRTASSRRAALREQRAGEQQAAQRKRLVVRISVVAAAVLALVAGVAVGAIVNNRTAQTASGEVVIGAAAPANATTDGAVRVGSADAPVTVSIFTDFMCPYCKTFDEANAEALSTLLQADRVSVQVYPLTFLDAASQGTRYSMRAANAFATVANADPNLAWNFYQLLYAHQPAEGTTGLSDTQLIQLAEQAGASKEVAAAIGKLAYRAWTDEVTKSWYPERVQGTPTILVNGTRFEGDPYSAGPLAQAIEKAVAGG